MRSYEVLLRRTQFHASNSALSKNTFLNFLSKCTTSSLIIKKRNYNLSPAQQSPTLISSIPPQPHASTLTPNLLATTTTTSHLPGTTPPKTTMPFFRITLLRSAIGLPLKTRGALNALGLYKRGNIVYKPVSAASAGSILKVKELVAVSEVEERLTKEEEREKRRPERGYVFESAVGGEGGGGGGGE